METTREVKEKAFSRNRRRGGGELQKGNREASPKLTIPW